MVGVGRRGSDMILPLLRSIGIEPRIRSSLSTWKTRILYKEAAVSRIDIKTIS